MRTFFCLQGLRERVHEDWVAHAASKRAVT